MLPLYLEDQASTALQGANDRRPSSPHLHPHMDQPFTFALTPFWASQRMQGHPTQRSLLLTERSC